MALPAISVMLLIAMVAVLPLTSAQTASQDIPSPHSEVAASSAI